MTGIINFPFFVLTSIILIMAPGPDFLYVTTRGISQGKRAGLLSAAGISTGLLIHTLLAAFGLSAIVQASRIAYEVIKFIGAAYLVYLGVRTVLSKEKLIDGENEIGKKKNSFHQGVLTNVFNPKAIITFMAFLPQFVDIKIKHPIFQFLFLGIILSVIALTWFGVIGYFSGLVGSFIKGSKKFQNTVKYISGSILVMLGLRLAIKEN